MEVSGLMRLARLTLVGFKSFADRTEFTFDAPLTGIVGPNGCGKSNVVDAIKWVLGERSAKSLRSKEMADVIFAGSAGRKPQGMASVTLTFENPLLEEVDGGAVAGDAGEHSNGTLAAALNGDAGLAALLNGEADHGSGRVAQDAESHGDDDEAPAFERPLVRRRALPIDTETVDVERRLYRDGTSLYLINGRKARLRDIRDLFLDTGVGADAYSIIEQGKVDAMLLASPVERRTIFEEAAGVAKFKARRIEAQRKLERTEMNLVAAREALATTERRLRVVKSQAAKARRFQELDTSLRGLKMALWFDQHHDLLSRLDGLTSSLHDLEQKRREAAEDLSRLEQTKQDADLARHDLLTAHRDMEIARSGAEHAAESARQRAQMCHRSAEEARRQIGHDESRLRDVEARIDEISQAAEEQRSAMEASRDLLEAAERTLQEAGEERSRLQGDLAERRAALSDAQAAATNIDRERTALVAQVESERRRAHALGEQAEASRGAVERLRQERAGLDLRGVEARAQVDRRQEGIGRLEASAAERSRAAETLFADQRALTDALNRLEQKRVALDSRRATLQEMVEARAGYADAVRAVMDRRDADIAEGAAGAGRFATVIAPLAELIETDAAHAAAVEAALGDDLQALLVHSTSALVDSGAIRELPGRVTFLPVGGALRREGEQPAPRPEALGLPAERVRPALDVVKCDPRARVVVERLLEATYLVEDIEAALMLAAGPMARVPGARFVTRAGETLFADGRIVAGPAAADSDAAAGVLQRRSELNDLEDRVEALDAEIGAQRRELASVDARAAALDIEIASLRQSLAAEQRGLVGDHAALDRIDSEQARIGRELPRAEEELATLIDRAASLAREQADLTERAERLGRLHAEQVEKAAQMQARLAEGERELENAAERLTAARVEAGQRHEKLQSASRELRRLEAEAENAQRDLRQVTESMERLLARVEEHERAGAEAAEQARLSQVEAASAAERLSAMQSELGEAAQRCQDLGERVNIAREHMRHVERDWHSVEVARREIEVKRENLEQRAMEDISLDLAFERADYAALMAGGDVAAIDAEAVSAEIEEVREQIKRLGNVNLDALEEETQLESRNEDLIRQVADIDAARATLTDLIHRLSDASRDRFKEVFEAIQANFGGEQGMFRQLFGGGKAELLLMPHPETGEIDWLESGVEVRAKPPGKEPRTISQLSGGEKTMTAVALLLSIFESKPSPFCLLDEVDAALDEANVGRFCDVVRRFLDRCHMIVITHHKRTMRSMDQLYGVTMQERGVSTRVSVRMDEIEGQGEAKSGAAPEKRAPRRSTNGEAGGGEDRPTLRRRLADMRADPEPVAPEAP